MTTLSARHIFEIDETIDTTLPANVKGIYVGVSGDLDVTTDSGSRIIIPGVAAGITHPWQIRKVWAAGTTAEGIRGMTD